MDKKERQEKIKKILYRINKERIENPNSTVMARLIASNLESGKFNIKIIVRINDPSFLCRQIKLWYSAGISNYQSIQMDKVDDYNYAIVLANIPVETTVLYYLEMLDRGGVWLKRMYDDNEQKPFQFIANKSGVKEIGNWNDPSLIKCEVCDYMCRKEWEFCPGCNSPLHDQTQEIFLDAQIQKEKNLEKITNPDEIAWNEMQSSDKSWKSLPECPNCGISVQPEWKICPVCNSNLRFSEEKKIQPPDKL